MGRYDARNATAVEDVDRRQLHEQQMRHQPTRKDEEEVDTQGAEVDPGHGKEVVRQQQHDGQPAPAVEVIEMVVCFGAALARAVHAAIIAEVASTPVRVQSAEGGRRRDPRDSAI